MLPLLTAGDGAATAMPPGNPTTLPLESVQQFTGAVTTLAVPAIKATCVNVNVTVPLSTLPLLDVVNLPVTVPAVTLCELKKISRKTIGQDKFGKDALGQRTLRMP